MPTRRVEAFSDGVIAILITIMVLELRTPHGTTWSALSDSVPVLLSYALSFVYLGIYWNNHHHLLMATERVNGLVLWANLNLLFWLSLVPFATGWLGENKFAATPAAAYGIVLLASALAFYGLQRAIIRVQGGASTVALAIGRDLKGKASPLLYALGIGLAAVDRRLSVACYVIVALMWLIPDRRVERVLTADPGQSGPPGISSPD
jgi:uncharacterized membrane protein